MIDGQIVEMFVGVRGSGKTEQAMAMAHRRNAVLVVPTSNGARAIKDEVRYRQSKGQLLGVKHVISVQDFMNGRADCDDIVFDEAQDCLAMIVKWRQKIGWMKGLTISLDEHSEVSQIPLHKEKRK